MKKRIVTAVLIVSMPLMLLAVVAQSARHHALMTEVRILEQEQASLVEQNRRLLADIAAQAARFRVEAEALERADTTVISPANTLRIRVGASGGRQDG